jgi:hypothetical protein
MYKILMALALIFITGCAGVPPVNIDNQIDTNNIFGAAIKECELQGSLLEKKNCKDNVLLQQAISLDDETYCNFASTTISTSTCKDFFFLEKASSRKMSSFCGFINEPEMREICKEVTS